MSIAKFLQYKPGDIVYYKLPDSPPGLILDACMYLDGKILYMVSFEPGDAVWVRDFELSTSKLY